MRHRDLSARVTAARPWRQRSQRRLLSGMIASQSEQRERLRKLAYLVRTASMLSAIDSWCSFSTSASTWRLDNGRDVWDNFIIVVRHYDSYRIRRSASRPPGREIFGGLSFYPPASLFHRAH